MIKKLQNWILDRKFVRDALIKSFLDARKDFEESVIDKTEEKAKELMEQRLNDMLSNCDLRKVVSKDARGIIYIGGEIAKDEQLLNLKSEAEYLMSTNLWTLLYETPKLLAERAMFKEGDALKEQLAKGRSILYTLQTQKNILDIFLSFKK